MRMLLSPTLVLAGALAALPAAAQQGSGLPAVLAGLTSQHVTDDLGNGCWVRFYDGQDFRGRSITLAGPVDLARIQLPGRPWTEWDSAIVGPQATVTTYDDKNFRERTARLARGERVADLRQDKLGWHEQVRSARVDCVT